MAKSALGERWQAFRDKLLDLETPEPHQDLCENPPLLAANSSSGACILLRTALLRYHSALQCCGIIKMLGRVPTMKRAP